MRIVCRNASKCKIDVFNEQTDTPEPRQWYTGNNPAQESDNYTHIGIVCNKTRSLDVNVKYSCNKLQRTFFSLTECGIHGTCLNLLMSRRIHESIVLSRAINGCELWSLLTIEQLTSLERVYRQCIRHIQSLPSNTSTDVPLSMVGIWPISNLIDKWKLLLYGQFCVLDHTLRAKQLLTHRLTMFMSNPNKVNDLISAIFKIMGTYKRAHVITEYVHSGSCPRLTTWKRLVLKPVHHFVRCQSDPSSLLYIHTRYKPCFIWEYSR